VAGGPPRSPPTQTSRPITFPIGSRHPRRRHARDDSILHHTWQTFSRNWDTDVQHVLGTAQVHHLLARGIAVPDATTSGIRHALVTGAAFAAAAALIALATTNTHQDPNQAHAAEPQAGSPLAAAAPEPIKEEIKQ
jgi:hypothetical protein